MKLSLNLKSTDSLGRILLEPEKMTAHVETPSVFDHEGRYDLDTMVEGLLDGFAKAVGVLPERLSCSLEEFIDIKQNLAEDLISHIRQARNVLPVFDKDGEPATNREGLTVVPLKVRGSGRKLVLEIRTDEQGELDTDHIIDQIEGCFREMLHVAN